MHDIIILLEQFFKDLTKKENMPARLLSLLLACMLWIYVTMEKNPTQERGYDVHLNQLNLPSTMTVYNAPDTVRVRLRGPRSVLTDKTGAGITASVDLKSVGQGEQKVPVKVHTRHGEVIAVIPQTVSLYVDTLNQKRVPVSTRVIGKIGEDMTVGNVSIEPTTVTISGATNQIAKVSRVIAPIDVTNFTGDFQTESDLVAISDDGYDIPNMSIEPRRVLVKARMVPQLLTVELPVEFVSKGALAEGYELKSITLEPAKIKLSAAPSSLKGLLSVKTKPLDISALKDSSTPVVELDLPEQCVTDVKMVKAQLTINKLDDKDTKKQEKSDKETDSEAKN